MSAVQTSVAEVPLESKASVSPESAPTSSTYGTRWRADQDSADAQTVQHTGVRGVGVPGSGRRTAKWHGRTRQTSSQRPDQHTPGTTGTGTVEWVRRTSSRSRVRSSNEVTTRDRVRCYREEQTQVQSMYQTLSIGLRRPVESSQGGGH